MVVMKRRHGCLTTWLIISMFGSLAGIFTNWLYLNGRKTISFDVADWVFYCFIALSVLNLVFLIGLIKWKRWGFWGICLLIIATVVVNLAGSFPVIYSLLGLMLIPFDYFVLQIGKQNKGWPQLD